MSGPSQLLPKRIRKTEHGPLARRITRGQWQRDDRRCARNVDQTRLRSSNEIGKKRMRHGQQSGEIDRYGGQMAVERNVQESAAEDDAGIIDEHIDWST